jgi:hypothetical protein
MTPLNLDVGCGEGLSPLPGAGANVPRTHALEAVPRHKVKEEKPDTTFTLHCS